MKCVVCKHGETQNGYTTFTLDRGNATVVIKHAPARVCNNCGEAYLEAETARRVTEIAVQAESAGTLVQVQEFKAA